MSVCHFVLFHYAIANEYLFLSFFFSKEKKSVTDFIIWCVYFDNLSHPRLYTDTLTVCTQSGMYIATVVKDDEGCVLRVQIRLKIILLGTFKHVFKYLAWFGNEGRIRPFCTLFKCNRN